jgi:hypothetical protein
MLKCLTVAGRYSLVLHLRVRLEPTRGKHLLDGRLPCSTPLDLIHLAGTNQGILKEKYHCTIDLLFDWFGISCMTTDNFCFYLQNRLIQTNQTGGQRYSDTSPFSIPWTNIVKCSFHLQYKKFYNFDTWSPITKKLVAWKYFKYIKLVRLSQPATFILV